LSTAPLPHPEDDFTGFCLVIRRAFAGTAQEIDGRGDGIVWKWNRRGLWTITAGATLHPEPVLTGPAGEWRIAHADPTGATYALMVLAGADALPDGVEVPPPARPAGGLYAAGGIRIPESAPAATPGQPIQLRPAGPRDGDRQPVLTPYGGTAIVNARTGGNFITAVGAGTAAVVVPPFIDLPWDAPIPATLHTPPQLPSVRPPAPEPAERGGFRPSPSPRPAHRTFGGNTGARPGPAWAGRPRSTWDDDRPVADVPAAGLGPGAAYAPEVLRDDRVSSYGVDCGPTVVAGSDLPSRGADIPTAPVSSPAPVEDRPAYGGGGGNDYGGSPSPGCD
jgi:hypothetical protein